MFAAHSTHSPSHGSARASADAARDRRRAWLALLLYPLSFVAAFAVGEGLAALMGYPSGDGSAPWYVALLAGVPALLVFVLPGLLSLRYGRRAARAGDPSAMVPVIVGLTIGATFVAMNLVGLLVGLLAGGL